MDNIINNDLFQNGLGKTNTADLGSLAKTAATVTRYYTFTVPDILGGDYTFIRFRLDTYTESGLSPSGFGAGYGEVEDYYATLDDTPPVSTHLISFEAEQSDEGIRLFWKFENLQKRAVCNVLRSLEKAGQYKQSNK